MRKIIKRIISILIALFLLHNVILLSVNAVETIQSDNSTYALFDFDNGDTSGWTAYNGTWEANEGKYILLKKADSCTILQGKIVIFQDSIHFSEGNIKVYVIFNSGAYFV